MEDAKRQLIHDEAWAILDSKGLSLGEKMKVRSAFVEWSGLRDSNPNVISKKHDSEIYFQSTHEGIKNMIFKTEKEVVLANSIYLNLGDNFEPNTFIQMFKFTCRIIGLDSEWSK